jgi:hypothetical protein
MSTLLLHALSSGGFIAMILNPTSVSLLRKACSLHGFPLNSPTSMRYCARFRTLRPLTVTLLFNAYGAMGLEILKSPYMVAFLWIVPMRYPPTSLPVLIISLLPQSPLSIYIMQQVVDMQSLSLAVGSHPSSLTPLHGVPKQLSLTPSPVDFLMTSESVYVLNELLWVMNTYPKYLLMSSVQYLNPSFLLANFQPSYPLDLGWPLF